MLLKSYKISWWTFWTVCYLELFLASFLVKRSIFYALKILGFLHMNQGIVIWKFVFRLIQWE